MNKVWMIVALLLGSLGLSVAHAHGDAQARHGGVAQMAGDLGFELVAQPGGGAVIYVEDHGKPMAPTGMSGKLTVLKGSEKTEYPLTVAADRLEATGAKLPSGAKVVAVLGTAGKKTITVRFSIK